MTKNILCYEDWSECIIRNRANQFAKPVNKMWNYQKVKDMLRSVDFGMLSCPPFGK